MSPVGISKWAKVAGIGTALLITAIASWTWFASLCRGIDGRIVGFGFMCEAPACDPQPLFSIMPTHQALASALIVLIFVGVPIGLLAYATVRRWLKPPPPE